MPKKEDIYSNKENVLIIPQSEIEEFNNLEEELHANRVANYLYMMEVEKLEQLINNNDNSSEYEKIIEELKEELHAKEDEINNLEAINQESKQYTMSILKEENDKIKTRHSRLIEENENLKNKYVNMKIENENLKTKCSTLREEHADIKSSYDNVTSKYDQLKQENLNTKTSYAEMYEVNESLEKDYDDLRLDYNDLVDKYNDLEEELYKLKTTRTRDEYIASKVKEFMINKEI